MLFVTEIRCELNESIDLVGEVNPRTLYKGCTVVTMMMMMMMTTTGSCGRLNQPSVHTAAQKKTGHRPDILARHPG